MALSEYGVDAAAAMLDSNQQSMFGQLGTRVEAQSRLDVQSAPRCEEWLCRLLGSVLDLLKQTSQQPMRQYTLTAHMSCLLNAYALCTF